MTKNAAVTSRDHLDRQINTHYFFNFKTIISARVMLLGLIAIASARYLSASSICHEAEKSLDHLNDLKNTIKDIDTLMHAECTPENAVTQNPYTPTGKSFWLNCNEILYPDREVWEYVKLQWSLRDPNLIFKKAEKTHELPPSIINGVRM